MADRTFRLRIHLMLAIGIMLLLRSFMRPDLMIVDNHFVRLDLVGLIGFGCLVGGFFSALRHRRLAPSLHNT